MKPSFQGVIDRQRIAAERSRFTERWSPMEQNGYQSMLRAVRLDEVALPQLPLVRRCADPRTRFLLLGQIAQTGSVLLLDMMTYCFVTERSPADLELVPPDFPDATPSAT